MLVVMWVNCCSVIDHELADYKNFAVILSHEVALGDRLFGLHAGFEVQLQNFVPSFFLFLTNGKIQCARLHENWISWTANSILILI